MTKAKQDLAPELNTVQSRDGSAIEYLTVGEGPGLVMVHGALATATDLFPLAALLADRYTVHFVNRRGRGGSVPQGPHYGMASECDDLHAVCAATGSRLVFGHSFGGLVALQFGRSNPMLHAVAVYEPGVSIDNSIPADWIQDARAELDRGRPQDAFLTFIRGINPKQTGRVPRTMLRLILHVAIPRTRMARNLELMPASLTEHQEVGRLADTTNDYAQIQAPTLIMQGGARSSSHALPAMRTLADTIPRGELITLPKLNHFAPEQDPQDVAKALQQFFHDTTTG